MPVSLFAFLDAHHVAHLATAGEGGPHAAPVFYARLPDSPEITWISAPHVLHSRHLLAGPEMGASISPSAPPLGAIEGVQLRGRGASPDARQDELAAGWLARFTEARGMIRPDHRFWVLTPSWARLVRTVDGRPKTEEWTFPPVAARDIPGG